ncbi:MAG TPA: hypothetical protein VKZ51_05280 [Cyclobacteriaceae bacterium]|nr:hypothetical protein [Cyclobacteriaceae bacterium]
MKKGINITGMWVCLAMVCQIQACAPEVRGLSTEGTIIATENDRVYTLFEDVLGNTGSFTGGWFYFPGVGIVNKSDYKIKVILEENK